MSDLTGSVSRTLTNLGNSCASSAECSWLRNAKATEHGAAVSSLFGAEEQDIAEVLDIRELLNATASKRAERIAQMLSKGAKSPREKAEAIAKQALGRLLEMDPSKLPEDYRLLYPIAPKQVQAILKREASMLEAKIGEAGIQGATSWANEAKKEASSGLKQKDAAKKELEARIALLPVTEATQERIAALDLERTTLAQRIGTAEERAKRKADAEARMRIAGEAHATATRRHDSAVQNGPDHDIRLRELPSLKAQLERLTREIAEHVPPVPPANDAAAAKRVEAERMHDEAFGMTIQVPNEGEIEKFKRDLMITEGNIREAVQSPWSAVLDHAKHILALHNKAWGKVANEIQEHAETIHCVALVHLPNMDSLETLRRIGTAELEKACRRKGAIELENARILTQRTEMMKKASSLRADADDAEREQGSAYDAARKNWQSHSGFLNDQRGKAERTIRQLERLQEDEQRLIDASETALKRATDDAETCRQALASIEAPEDVGGLQTQRSAVAVDLKRLTDARSTADELTKIVTEIDGLTAERDVFGALEWACQRVREQEIQEQGAGLLGRIDGFLTSAGRTEKAYIRAGKGAVTIGWRRGGSDIPVQALSGGEWCLFCAAFTCALLAIRPAELRFLLVEAGEADDATMKALCSGIQAQEHLTCAIVCTPHKPEWAQKDWNWKMIELR